MAHTQSSRIAETGSNYISERLLANVPDYLSTMTNLPNKSKLRPHRRFSWRPFSDAIHHPALIELVPEE
eukprot:6748837-Karenia_brevis.AAC.1